MNKLNFAFWGTPEIARDTLEILKDGGFLPSIIVTAPDKPKGRGLRLSPTPVKVWAEENKITCVHDFDNLPPLDLSVVVAYGKIIPESILNTPKHGSINVHYSLLPKYRGASPVESAILAEDKETGVTIQKMIHKLDAGPILVQEKTPILASEHAPELKKRLTTLGGDMLVKFLQNPNFQGEEQDEARATHSRKISKSDGELDLSAPGEDNYRKFRAYAGWPRTYFFENGKRMIITDATLENDRFVVKKIIPEGGKERDY